MKSMIKAITTITLILFAVVCYAEGYNLFDMYQKPDQAGTIPKMDYQPLNGKFPLVGADEATSYFLDSSSCTWYQNGNNFIIACLVYSANGGLPPKVKPLTYKFNVYKAEIDYGATLISINDSEESAQQQLNFDNGYLRFLLLQAANFSNFPSSKIQLLNDEAERQLKIIADAEEAERQRQEAKRQELKRQQELEQKQREQTQQQQSYNYDEGYYIGNLNSGIFHRSGCPSVSRMRSYNKITFNSRDEAVSNGYTPCKRCRP